MEGVAKFDGLSIRYLFEGFYTNIRSENSHEYYKEIPQYVQIRKE